MRRSAFLFFKGLGLLFAILCGIGTAILGWYDGADWMNIVTFSIAVTGLILWGWYHFSIRWIDSDLKQNILSQFPKKDQVEGKDLPEEDAQVKKAKEWVLVRQQRDALIKSQSKYIEQYLSEVRRKVTPTIDIAIVDNYVEELRQIPQKNSDPFNINWPKDWITETITGG